MDRTKRPRLIDVAHAADVSVATASYVLANRAGVTISAETRARVLRCADELGYRRNALAAALRSGGLREIGVHIASRPVGAQADVVFELAELASARGYATVVQIGSDYKPNRFEAVFAIGPLPPDLDPAEYLRAGTPIVGIGSSGAHCQVLPDDFGGTRQAINHLLSLGHRRIAHFAGPQADVSMQERLRGFLDSVHEAGLRMDATPIFHSLGDFTELMKSDLRPTAVLAHSDESAFAICTVAREAGHRLPGDLSVVGFGDESFAARTSPSLTTIRTPSDLIASTAFSLLERLMARTETPSQTLIPCELITRDSTAPPYQPGA